MHFSRVPPFLLAFTSVVFYTLHIIFIILDLCSPNPGEGPKSEEGSTSFFIPHTISELIILLFESQLIASPLFILSVALRYGDSFCYSFWSWQLWGIWSAMQFLILVWSLFISYFLGMWYGLFMILFGSLVFLMYCFGMHLFDCIETGKYTHLFGPTEEFDMRIPPPIAIAPPPPSGYGFDFPEESSI